MKAHGEAVGFIAQAAQQLHTQLVGLTLQGLLGPWHEHFLPLLG
jgi:hypothetical protein